MLSREQIRSIVSDWNESKSKADPEKLIELLIDADRQNSLTQSTVCVHIPHPLGFGFTALEQAELTEAAADGVREALGENERFCEALEMQLDLQPRPPQIAGAGGEVEASSRLLLPSGL